MIAGLLVKMDLTSVGLKCKFSDVSLTWANFTQLDYLNMNGNNLQVCLPVAADDLQCLHAPGIERLHPSRSRCDDPRTIFACHLEVIYFGYATLSSGCAQLQSMRECRLGAGLQKQFSPIAIDSHALMLMSCANFAIR